jgi:hypothetical protein
VEEALASWQKPKERETLTIPFEDILPKTYNLSVVPAS